MQEALQKRFPDLVALFSALGFLTLLSELLLTGHTEGIQALAPLAAGVGTWPSLRASGCGEEGAWPWAFSSWWGLRE